MIRSASSLKDTTLLEADVVVVGAGPLGIVTALELADAGHRVLVVESGGRRPSAAAQGLSAAASKSGDPWHAPKHVAVRRQLGGTSTLWGGRCVPFDPIDYEPRPAVPEQLWPLNAEDVAGYLGRACEWCRCGRPIFDVAHLPELAGRSMVPGLPDGDVRTTSLERWALPTRFGRVYRRRLARNPLLELLTDLTCVQIQCNDQTGAVSGLALRSPTGKTVNAVGRYYVLANGGLEVTRLLMASDDVHSAGIGNHSGHLGRWYMAHVEARVADVELDTPASDTIYDHERDRDGIFVRRRFTFSPEFQVRTGMPNCALWFVNPRMGDPSHGSGILSGVYLTLISPLGRFLLAEGIRQAGTRNDAGRQVRAHLANIVRDLLPAARFAVSFSYSRFLRPGRKAPGFFVKSAANMYPLDYHGEHIPHWESRVVLTDERDASGLRRLRTELHFSKQDIRSVRLATEQLDAYLRSAGVGRLRYLYDDIDSAVRAALEGTVGYHQTGTTRMANEPAHGVVDANLAVFGVENLFVASTSVLPTSSQANPTLTGVALSVRLADHLHSLLPTR